VARVSEKLRSRPLGPCGSPTKSVRVGAGPVGSGRARVVEFSLKLTTSCDCRRAVAKLFTSLFWDEVPEGSTALIFDCTWSKKPRADNQLDLSSRFDTITASKHNILV